MDNPMKPHKFHAKSTAAAGAAPSKSRAAPSKSRAAPSKSRATPSKSRATPSKSRATAARALRSADSAPRSADRAPRDPREALPPSADDVLGLRRLPACARRAALEWWPGRPSETWAETLAVEDASVSGTGPSGRGAGPSGTEISGLRSWHGRQGRAWIASLRILPWAARAAALAAWPGRVDPRTRWEILRLSPVEGGALRCLPVTARAAAIAALAVKAADRPIVEAFKSASAAERKIIGRQLAKLILGKTFAAWTDDVTKRLVSSIATP